ncbi:hypothetical protein FACS1894204_07930 [Synergistales bacterium]|nr:hypothetical protein FACS1894204_07930 [Synergistales bacterium]
MRANKAYEQAIEQANTNLADFRERGADAIGSSWEDVRNELLTPEERAASNLRVAMMIELANARTEKGISQKKLEAMSGVKQPIIARMEKGYTSPRHVSIDRYSAGAPIEPPRASGQKTKRLFGTPLWR